MAKPRVNPKPITPEGLAASGTEDGHQMALFAWASSPQAQAEWPDLRWLFAIANGGYRNKVTAVRLRAMGVKKGIPDICLGVRRGSFACLWIELKIPKREDGRRAGTARKEQTVWLDHFKEMGHGAIVCRGWDHARQVIIQYLEWDGK